MYLGRFTQGQIVQIDVRTVDRTGKVSTPDDAPLLRVLSTTSAIVSQRMPVLDSQAIPGLFSLGLPLDSQFKVGRYTAMINWRVAGYVFGELRVWEVVGGGHPDGDGIALYHYSPPTSGSSFLVLQTNVGKLFRFTNPRLE